MSRFHVAKPSFFKAQLLRTIVAMTGVTVIACLSTTLESQRTNGEPAAAEQTSTAARWETAAGGKMAFDVASVRQDKSGTKPFSNVKLSNLRTAYPLNGGVFSARNYDLLTYIAFAYKLSSQQMDIMVRSLPEWVYTDRFDIEAKSENHSPTKDQMRLMLQAVLEDRFKLVSRMELRQIPAFGVILAKPGKTGPQLKQHSADSPCPATSSVSSAVSAPVETILRTWPPNCNHIRFSRIPGGTRLAGRDVSMGELVGALTESEDGVEGRVFVDQTGLSGTFDFVVDFAEESGPSADGDESKIPAEDRLPGLMEAVADDLGFKLVKKTAPADCFVVVHVEHPSAN